MSDGEIEDLLACTVPYSRDRQTDQSRSHKIEAGSAEYSTLAMKCVSLVPLVEGHAAA